MNRELRNTKKKIEKLIEKKALIDEQLEPLLLLEEKLEDQEIVTVCRVNHITIEDLMNIVKNAKMEEIKDDENKNNDEY